MTTYALRLANNVDTAARVRMADMLAIAPGPSPLTARTGVRPDGGGAVSVVNGAMQVQVAPLMGWIQSGTTAQAGYPVVSDATETLTIAAGHASLTRIDTIAVQVRDNAADGSGATDTRLLVIAGTPGAGAPALPATTLPLRDINVPAGASAGNGGLTASNLGADRRVLLDPVPKTVDTSTSDITISSSNTAATVPGLSRTVTVRSGQVLVVTAELDAESGSTIWQPVLFIDGAAYGVAPGLNFTGRNMVIKTWRVPGLTPGDHTVSIRAGWQTGATLRVVAQTSSLIIEQRLS